MTEEEWSEDKFEKIKQEFSGYYSETYKIVHKDTMRYAFLDVSKEHYEYKSKYLSLQHIWEIASVHPYIAKLYSSYMVAENKYYIYEYLPYGSIRDFIQVHRILQTKTAKLLTAQIASAIEFLHSKEIFHRDISNRYIILSDDGKAKISSFRHALMNKTALGVHGDLYYQAPEVFQGKVYDMTADWYSLGVCLYEMLVGVTPLEYHCLRKAIKFKSLDFTGQIVVILSSRVFIPKIFSNSLKNVLNRLLAKNREERLGYKDRTEMLKNHPFFTDVEWQQVENGQLKADLPRKEKSKLEKDCPKNFLWKKLL